MQKNYKKITKKSPHSFLAENFDDAKIIDSEDKSSNRVEFLNTKLSTFGYEPDIIGLKKIIVEDLYKHKKYYLD